MENICFNFSSDYDTINKLIKKYGAKGLFAIGKNEDGESIIITIYSNRVVTKTLQKNNWMRINTYWADGNIDENYER